MIAVDYRGAGDSSKPITGYNKVTLAEDIYQLVQQLGFQQINLVGHDIGLMVAYAYVAADLENVRRLVLFDAPLPGTRVWEQLLSAPRAWHFVFHGKRNIPEMLVAGRERHYLSGH